MAKPTNFKRGVRAIQNAVTFKAVIKWESIAISFVLVNCFNGYPSETIFFFWYKHTYHTVSKTQKRSVVMIRMKNTLQYHRWRIHSLSLAQEFSINLKFHIKGTEYLAIIKRSKTNNWKCTCKGSWRKYRTKYVWDYFLMPLVTIWLPIQV